MNIQNKIEELRVLFDSDYKLINDNKINSESIYNKYLSRKGLINKLYSFLSNVNTEEKSKVGKEID